MEADNEPSGKNLEPSLNGGDRAPARAVMSPEERKAARLESSRRYQERTRNDPEAKRRAKESHKRYRQRNRELVNERRREYRRRNPDKPKAHLAKYRGKNRKALTAKQQDYYLANRAAEMERARKYREANREVLGEKARRYYHENREAVRARERERCRKAMDARERTALESSPAAPTPSGPVTNWPDRFAEYTGKLGQHQRHVLAWLCHRHAAEVAAGTLDKRGVPLAVDGTDPFRAVCGYALGRLELRGLVLRQGWAGNPTTGALRRFPDEPITTVSHVQVTPLGWEVGGRLLLHHGTFLRAQRWAAIDRPAKEATVRELLEWLARAKRYPRAEILKLQGCLRSDRPPADVLPWVRKIAAAEVAWPAIPDRLTDWRGLTIGRTEGMTWL